ncbi:MAG: alkaline phosphatase family protein [Anaerolineae bacterium]|nr:alkaline phosphatase family protein [Anaerolineae bacterium]
MRGAWGQLRSTVPPMTGPAWTTFATGANPARHSIYDWVYREPGTYNFVPATAANRRLPSLWSLLSAAGRRGRGQRADDLSAGAGQRPVDLRPAHAVEAGHLHAPAGTGAGDRAHHRQLHPLPRPGAGLFRRRRGCLPGPPLPDHRDAHQAGRESAPPRGLGISSWSSSTALTPCSTPCGSS